MTLAERNVLQRKIALMGYPCVGKSSITMRFINGTFPDAYDTTIEDYHLKNYQFLGKKYILTITDTAGQQEYSLFPRSCSLNIDGYILVFAINDRKSFEILRTIYDKITEKIGNNFPLIIVGNKLDLQYTSRVVEYGEGVKMAVEFRGEYVETSAKDNTDVQKIFNQLLRAIEVSKGNITRNKFPSCLIS